MFNPDFYPTPPEVAATMLDCPDLRALKAALKAGPVVKGASLLEHRSWRLG